MGEQTSTHTPVTYHRCTHIEGPFYHGTKSALETGADLVPGYGSNFQQGREEPQHEKSADHACRCSASPHREPSS